MRHLVAAVGLAFAVAFLGCTSLLGDFSVGSSKDGGPSDAPATTDATPEGDAHADVRAKADANTDANADPCSKGPGRARPAWAGHAAEECALRAPSSCTRRRPAPARRAPSRCDPSYTSCTTGGVAACFDLTANPKNCGACGHACGAGRCRCTGGFCDPVTVLQRIPARDRPLARERRQRRILGQLDVTSHGVRRRAYQVSISGGSAIQISSTSPTGPGGQCRHFRVHDRRYTINWGGEQTQFFSGTKGSRRTRGPSSSCSLIRARHWRWRTKETHLLRSHGRARRLLDISKAALSGTGGKSLFTSTSGSPGEHDGGGRSNAVFWTGRHGRNRELLQPCQ